MNEQELSMSERMMIRFGELSRQSYLRVNRSKLRHGERGALFCLKYAKNSPIKASDLATALNMAAPGVTFLLNRLEASGYIRREPDLRDRRVVLVELTDEGRAEIDADLERIRRQFDALAEHLGEADCHEFLRLFDKVLQYCTKNHV